MGSSSDLLEIISDPPVGSENLLLQVEIVILMIWPTLLKDSMLTRFSVYIVGTLFQVLHTLTDGTVPSQELIFTIKKLYDSKLKVNHSVLLIVFKKKLWANVCLVLIYCRMWRYLFQYYPFYRKMRFFPSLTQLLHRAHMTFFFPLAYFLYRWVLGCFPCLFMLFASWFYFLNSFYYSRHLHPSYCCIFIP